MNDFTNPLQKYLWQEREQFFRIAAFALKGLSSDPHDPTSVVNDLLDELGKMSDAQVATIRTHHGFIARRVWQRSMDRVRRIITRRSNLPIDESLKELPEIPTHSPAEDRFRKKVEVMRECIDALSPQQARAVRFIYATYDDIGREPTGVELAKELGITRSGGAATLNKAREALRTAMRIRGFDL